MDIVTQLKQFNDSSAEHRKKVADFCHQSPYERTKQEIVALLQRGESYRCSIMRHIGAFSHLDAIGLVSAAQCLEEVYYKKGDAIIRQDEIGDSFYILEKGVVVVTVSSAYCEEHYIMSEIWLPDG